MEVRENVEKMLKEGKTVQFHPMGNSMFPLFKSASDSAIVKPLNGRLPKRLDVLVYRRIDGPLVIHRVYSSRNNELYMVGDRQEEIEGPLSFNCVLGIMDGYIRGGKKHSVRFLPYRVYSFLWMALRTKRHALFNVGHVIKILFYKIIGKEITHWN